LPEGFADGAASGRFASSISARAVSCAGTRTATVSSPALTSSESAVSSRRGSTSVSPPGQNRLASLSASALKTQCFSASSRFATCTISGLKRGRPFASKMLATALSSVASAPNP